MCKDKIERIISLYEEKKIKWRLGLSDTQVKQAEALYDIVFPPDVRQLIQAMKPEKGSMMSFPDWGDFSQENIDAIQKQLNWPIEGVLFDVEHNSFWLNAWGSKPATLQEQLLVASRQLQSVPKLIPITGHRYIPSTPNECGHPVYSVYQTDIIFYGENLWDYFEIEFKKKPYSQLDFSAIKPIPFWNDMAT